MGSSVSAQSTCGISELMGSNPVRDYILYTQHLPLSENVRRTVRTSFGSLMQDAHL